MKNILPSVLLAATLLLLPGCGTPGPNSYPLTATPIVQTNYVERVVTNVVDNVPVLSTNTVALVDTNLLYAVNTNLLSMIATAKGVNAAVNPTPSSPLVDLGLGALVAGLGWYARFKNNKLKAAQDLTTTLTQANDEHQSVISTLIAGVEKANQPAVKEAIAKVAATKGTSAAVDKAVQLHT